MSIAHMAFAAALGAALAAQEPEVQDPVQKQASELIDRFHKAMPHNPAELRAAAVRTRVAGDAVPVLRAIVRFVDEHRDSPLAARGLEFTIWALVLDDPATRDALKKQVEAKDASARLLLGCSAVIAAADAEKRAAAVEAFATQMRDRERPASASATRSAVQCLLIAGDLSEKEATVLAKSAPDEATASRFVAAASEAAKDPRLLLGKPIEIAGKLASGAAFTTASLRGKVVLVDFWATWCGPCVRALPDVVQAKKRFSAQGFEVVGVSSDRDAAALARFLAEHPEVDWPQLFEPGIKGFHPLAEKLGVQAIPRLFLIDKKGVLRSVDAHDELAELIARLLAE